MIKKIYFIIETIMLVCIIIFVSKCSSTKIQDLQQNINAYKTQIELVEIENSKLIATKESLILSEREVREELEISRAEFRALEKKLNDNIAYISKLESEVNNKDTIWMKADTIYINNNTIYKHFSWNDQWNHIDATVFGNSIEKSQLSINSFSIKVPLEVGLTDDYKLWAISENPNVEFVDIKGSVIQNSNIDDRKLRFRHGFHVGFGFHYGLFGRNWDFGPQVGYSLQLNF